MLLLRSIALFLLAALLEIGGAWLVWQGVREHRGLPWIIAGIAALGGVRLRRHPPARRPLRPDPRRVRRGLRRRSLAWGMVADGFRPDRYDVAQRARLSARCRFDHVRAARPLTRPMLRTDHGTPPEASP
ncbi:hypothetical protein GCM10020000_43700 [Streptomyces olivoverticillatus]